MTLREAERRRRQRWHSLEHTPLDQQRILSFRQWCTLNSISERTGRRILASGNGPAVVQLSPRRIGVRVVDNDDWQRSCERG
jgi:hypothetical protein